MKQFIIPETTYNRLKNRKIESPGLKTEKTDHVQVEKEVLIDQASSEEDIDDSFIIEAFSKKSRDRVQRLINYIRRNEPSLTWLPNGNVNIDGGLVEGSNIIDLLRTAVTGTVKKPNGWAAFSNVLKRINTPLALTTTAPPGQPVNRPKWFTH